MLLAGCSKDADISNSTLSGNGEKTPLLINATLDTGKGQTRAIGDTFEDGDVLKAYVRHTTNAGGVGSYTYLSNDPSSYGNKLVTITYDGSTFTSDSYWDDFSLNNDLKGDGHGLQAFYGYCYNHGDAYSGISETSGTLASATDGGTFTWQVQVNQNQTDANGYTSAKKSDVLWASEQTSVPYDHSTAHAGAGVNHGTLSLPYYHAMSEITVTVTASVGFDANNHPLTNTVLTLNKMNYESDLTARTRTFSPPVQTDGDKLKSITMYSESYTSPYTVRHFTAIVAPGTTLKEDVKLLDITDADGNDYEVIITSDMLEDSDGAGDDKGWSNSTPPTDGEGKHYIVTQPGVNYHLDITIDKSAVQVSASLADWTNVTATGTGAIQFAHEEVGFLTPNTGFANTSAFSLFRVVNSNSYDTPAERTNEAYIYATVSTFDGSKWNNSPSIYWPNKDDYYYYRALANVSSGDVTVASPTLTTAARGVQASNEKLTTIALSDEGYILWGTTAAHSSYVLGAAIPPRTGGVPLEFRVVNKCKVSFTLATADGGAAMDLSEASISINNIYNTGTINLEDGTVTGNATTTLEGTNSIAEQEILAQKISDNAVVTITFTKDEQVYSTYTIPLKKCVESVGSTFIEVWEGGHTYNYTIHVEKEDVKFSAAVKSWTTVSGSGTATMVNEQ